MKKRLGVLVLGAALIASTLVGCGSKNEKKIIIGASPTPHVEILEAAKPLLEAKGYELEIKSFTDYVQPNLALDSGELDANFFQHTPYLEQFNEERGLNLVSAGAIHYEPFALYPSKTKTIEELPDGAKISVPNDATNEARALLLLEEQGLIKIKEGVGLKATKRDIVENPKNIEIIELEAAQLTLTLADVDMSVINGNYAISGGLNVEKDSVAMETVESIGAVEFKNVVAVKEGRENDEAIKALIEVLQSEEIKKFIEEKYEGSVIPVF